MILITFLMGLISLLATVLSWLIIIAVLLSYFMDPYHPVRRWVDRIVEPMLAPVRRIIPPIGGLDLSPLVLLILIQLLARLIIALLGTLASR